MRYELENRASQLRLYDNQVDYATIYLSIDEVQEYTPVEEPTVWERISGGFVSSVKGVGNGLLDLLVWVWQSLPISSFWAALPWALLSSSRSTKPARRQRRPPSRIPPKKANKYVSRRAHRKVRPVFILDL